MPTGMRYDGPHTLGDILRARAASHPDHVIVRFDDSELTYGESLHRATAVALHLAGRGLVKDSRVATMIANSPSAIDLWFGCAIAGIFEVPLNVELKSDLLVDIVKRAGCGLLVVAHEFRPLVDPVADRLPPIIDVEDVPLDHPGIGTYVAPALGPQDTSVVLFTSGTSGVSKGVVLNHRANFRLAHAMIDNPGMRDGEVVYTTFPLFHIAARYVSVLVAMILNGRAVVHRKFSASRYWDICRTEKITAIHYLGTLPMMIWNQPPKPDDADTSVRLAYGAGMPPEIWDAYEKRFGLRVYELYGSTEQGAVTYTNDASRRVGTCGRVVADTELEIHDELGNTLPPGTTGEIVVRNRIPGIFFGGYLDMPEATVKAWRNLWFHTGDAGSLDADGYLTFRGRLKDSIRRRGENVSAYEVELVINDIPGVHESAAIGVPSDIGEEEILVVVQCEPGVVPDPAGIWRHCDEHLPRFAVPRYLRFVDDLPRTSTNRVEKYKLGGLDGSTLDRTRAH